MPQTISELIQQLTIANDLTPRECELLDKLVSAMDEIDALTKSIKRLNEDLRNGDNS